MPARRPPSPNGARRLLFAVTVLGLAAMRLVAAPPRLLPAGGLSAEAAALLMSGQEGGDVPLRLLVLPGEVDDHRSAVLLVEVDGAALLAPGEAPPVDVELSSYFLDADGAVAASLLDVVRLSDEEALEAVRASGLKYVATVDLEPGIFDLRLLVRNLKGGPLGLRAASLELPETADGDLLPPLVADRPESWVLAAGAVARSAMIGRLAATEVSTFPVLAAGQALSLDLVAGPGVRSHELRLELLAGDVAVAEVLPSWNDLADSGGEDGGTRSRLALAGLPEGEFRMRWRAGPLTSSIALPVVVVAGLGEARPVWAELGRSAARMPTGPGEGDRPKRLAIPPAEVARRLIATLRLLGGGEERAAVAALNELEETALAGNGALIEDLGRVEFRALRRLGVQEIESLVPAVGLYLQAYRASRAASSFLVSTHQRTMVEALSRHYAAAVQTPEASEIAAAALVRLFAEIGDGPGPSSERLLRSALELEPGFATALLALAFGLERRGEYVEARQLLAELVEAHPEHEEARLRLAIQSLRLADGTGDRQLIELIDEARSPWVRELAFQEHVRSLLRRDDRTAARKAIERARDEFPGSEKILLLAAYLDDLISGDLPAMEQLAGLPTDAAATESPRLRYGRLETDTFDKLELWLGEQTRQRLPALTQALPPATGSAP